MRAHISGGPVDDAEGLHEPAPVEPRHIVQLLVEQVLVGDHHLFAADRAHPRRFEPDLLDRARSRVPADRIAAAERPVEQDGERGEEIGENALRGEADGDAANAEARDQPGDVDPEIVEHDDERDREDGDGDEQPDDADRAAEAADRLNSAGPMSITPRTSSRAHKATCKVEAITKKTSIVFATDGGAPA